MRAWLPMVTATALLAVGCHAAAPPCHSTKRPVVVVHGFLAAGDTYALQAMRFASNGYCQDQIHAFDWDSVGDGTTDPATDLDTFIDAVRTEENTTQVDLVGHSAGAALGYTYLSTAGRAAKVAHYGNLAGLAQAGPAGPNGSVPTLNVWSDGDHIIMNPGPIPGATNLHLTTEDHYGTATCAQTFTALYQLFNSGAVPSTTDVTPQGSITLAGKALALGENTPDVGGTVAVYEVDSQTGTRKGGPIAQLTADGDGLWGPINASPGVTYELVATPKGSDQRSVHYYREAFTHTDHLVYLRTIPDPSTLAGALLASVRYDDVQTDVIAFIANHGLVYGQDSLTIAGTQAATMEIAAPSRTAIAVFAYDANGNMMTDATEISAFSSFPFLGGIDVFMPASPPGSIALVLNGHALNVHNWRSATDGPVVAVFNE